VETPDLCPDARLEAVARALGWPGDVARDVDLLGDRVDVVYGWEEERHRARDRVGLGPLADPWVFRCASAPDGGLADHPCPVQIVGVVVRRGSWRVARRVAAGFTGLAQAAVLLPEGRVSELDRADADRLGLGVVLDAQEPVVAVRPARYEAPAWTPVQDLAREIVYASAVTWMAASGRR